MSKKTIIVNMNEFNHNHKIDCVELPIQIGTQQSDSEIIEKLLFFINNPGYIATLMLDAEAMPGRIYAIADDVRLIDVTGFEPHDFFTAEPQWFVDI